MSHRSAAELLSTHTPALFDAAVKRAAEKLRAGEVVALPTETVYGLAANALEAKAVARIYEIKGRPAHNPIIVHVSDRDMAKRCVANWPLDAEKLADSFWPGPLTLVLPRAEHIPDMVTAGGNTVGVRWPSHPFIQAVIRACGFPLAAPSANLSNQLSPTNAEHVRKSLGDKISLIIDGGQAQVGIESTVVDLSSHPARLLRPGMIHEESLLAVLEELNVGAGEEAGTLRSPGMLKKHYSPRAKLVVWHWTNANELMGRLETQSAPPSRVFVVAHTHIPLSEALGRVSVIPHDAEAFARAIYGELHACDEAGAELIVVETPPQTAEWRAITDRLTRATA